MNNIALKKLAMDQLAWEPAVDPSNIEISVENGVVTLTGHVEYYAEKVVAKSAVQHLRGVRGVVDCLEVRPSTEAEEDHALARRAANLIGWDVTLPQDAISTKVKEGVIILRGDVEHEFQRRNAERDLRNLAGMRDVKNMITLHRPTRTDS